MNKTRVFGWSGVLVVTCMIGWVAGYGVRDAMEPLSVAAPKVVISDVRALDVPVTSRLSGKIPDRSEASSPTVSHPALPPIDMPFNQSVDVLEEAAREGDPVAACRLSSEAWRCLRARQMVILSPEDEHQIGRLANDDAPMEQLEQRVDGWLEQKQWMESTVASCEGVDISMPTLFNYDGMAASSGDPIARLRYLSSSHLDPAVVIRHPEMLTHYRTHAYAIFMQALEAGDLGVVALWQASVNPRSFDTYALSAVLPEAWQDPGVVDALVELLTKEQRSSVGSSVRHLGLAAGDVPSVEQQAEAAHLHARYFAANLSQKRQSTSTIAAFIGSDADPQHCQDLAY